MDREITVTYTPEIVRFTVRKFWTGYIGLRTLIVFLLLCAGFAGVYLSGDRSWLLGFLGAAVLVCGLMLGLTYRVLLARSMDKFRQMGAPTARLRFTDEFIGVESGAGRAELPWRSVVEIRRYEPAWMLFVDRQNFFTVPAEGLDAELREFIAGKVRAQAPAKV